MGDSDADLAHHFFGDDARDMLCTLMHLWKTVIKVVKIKRRGSIARPGSCFGMHHLCHLLAGILRTREKHDVHKNDIANIK